MAFARKLDWFGLSSDALKVSKCADGKAAQTVEAQGADGSVVASEVFGETLAPSCDYVVAGAVEWDDGAHPLGGLTETPDGGKVALTNVSITTSAGAAPSVSASGESVAPEAVQGCVYTFGAVKLSAAHHAQTLFGAFKFSGDGCHLTRANYTMETSLSKATVNGECVAHDVTQGKMTCAVSIIQVGSEPPTITPGEGWKLTSPLTYENPDANYKSYSATLTKYLAIAD